MNPYLLLADAARDFVLSAYRPCDYRYGDFQSSDGHLYITLTFKCTEDLMDYTRDYVAPEGVQVSYVAAGEGKEGTIYFYEKPQ
jgi:hypothetical protein